MDPTAARVSVRVIIVVHRPRIAKPLKSIRRDLVVVFMSLSKSVTETCSQTAAVSCTVRHLEISYYPIVTLLS
jgi:hypothetical protein